MSEKVIHEVRIIETDEGFRIEVKGDKERMREMGFGPDMFFGKHHGHGPHGWRRKFGPGFWRGFGFGPHWHPEPDFDETPPQKA